MKPPDELRARVARDLRPVRPHLRPWQRVVLLVPAAALAFAAAPGVFGIRNDVANIGTWLAWGGSLAQLLVAVVLMRAAFRQVVPGDAMPAGSARVLLLTAIGVIAALAFATNLVSPEPTARRESFMDWYVCWNGLVTYGLPLLGLLLLVLMRGLTTRPGLMGALAGMSAGTAVDGGWRLSCNYSNPVHVIGSHGGGVVALAAIGIVVAVTLARFRQK